MAQTELRGSLSRNSKRENDRQPEFRGSCLIDGTEYWISAWVRENDNGRYFSLAFKPKEMSQTDPRPAASPQLKAKYGTNGGNDRRSSDDHRRGVSEEEIPF